MRRAVIVVLKDVMELLANSRGVFLALVLPATFLYLVGQLRTEAIQVRVLLAGAGSEETTERRAADAAASALRQTTIFDVQVSEQVPASLQSGVVRNIDVMGLPQGDKWVLYTATTDPFRLGVIQQVTPRLEAVLAEARDQVSASRIPLPVPQALGQARSSLLAASQLARSWESGQQPRRPVPAPAAVLARGKGATPPSPVVPPVSVQRSNRTAGFDQAVSSAVSSLNEVIAARPDAFAWRNTHARVVALEERLKQLSTISRARVDDDEKQQLAAVAAEADAIANALVYDGPLDQSPPLSMQKLISEAGGTSGGTLMPLYASAGERPRALLPETAALIICLVPFVLTCHTLVREREERTLDVLLATPGMRSFEIISGKCASAVIVTLVVYLSLLAVMHLAYGLYLKPGLVLSIALGVVPAAAVAALLGLAVSVWMNSSLQATIASAIYLLVQSLVGGLFYPVATGAFNVVSLLGMAFPLTFLSPILRAWAFGAEPEWGRLAVPLLAMVLAYCVVARLAVAALLKRQ